MCSIITDIWPSPNMHIFISARLNFTDNDWKPKMVASQCFPIDEPHTLEHIVDVLGKIMIEWKQNTACTQSCVTMPQIWLIR